LGTTDFGPYLAQIKRDADAVFAVMVAASALRFPKQYQDAGLKARLPLIGGGTSFDEFVFPSLGDEAVGAITPMITAPRSTRRSIGGLSKNFGRSTKKFPDTTARRATRRRGG